jgi:OmpA-OmpF porin, OOP family
MKQNPFSWVLIAGFAFIANLTYAQENNYVVSKYDFIPGDKIIFFDDFSAENVGDFPAQWLTNGSGEIVTSAKFPGRWFQITKTGYYMPDASEDFTDNYTIEFDMVPMNTIKSETMVGTKFFLLSGSLSNPGYGAQPGQAGIRITPDYDNVSWNNWSEAREWQGDQGSVSYTFKSAEKYHIAFWIQKQRVRLYANETKVLDAPRALQANYKYNIFRIETTDDANPIISNFRIAAGLSDMRNKLLKDGKIISYGIHFDVNSDKLKPESYATLKEIADILKENSTMNIQIVGHTDSDGDAASNIDLSKRRAVSVKNELANKFGIAPERFSIDGKGQSEPLVPNSSVVNKAKNRRVEFINLTKKP